MDKNLRSFAMAGVELKRFSYNRNGQILICKPRQKEKFIIAEDFLGDRSIMWVACVSDNKEIWRHNIIDIVRITYANAIE